jgi:hypothetical protein
MPVPVPIFEPDGQPLGPFDSRELSLQRLNLLALYFAFPSSLITIRFMIGGCSAAGSLERMLTFNAVGLPALAGLTDALNDTLTAA